MKNASAGPQQAMVRKTAPFSSVVWLVPLLALITGAWLLVQHLRHTGPEITLYMDNAEGIEVNNTVVKVLNVTVGRITSVKLREDENGVELKAQMSADVRHLLRRDTQFWIVKPRIDQSGITGLNTLVSGAYLAFNPGHAEEKAEHFEVAELPPVNALGHRGLRLRLQGSSQKLLGPGSPVLYGDIAVGQVESARFDPASGRVHYQIYIDSPYKQLVGRDVAFWLQTGLRVSASGGNVAVDAPPLPALLSGAIAFAAPPEGRGEPVADNSEFMLYADRSEVDNQPGERALYYVVFFRQSVRGLTAGAPVEYRGIPVGSVSEVPYFERNHSHRLFAEGLIPVRLRLEPEQMEINADPQQREVWQAQIQAALARGLSASLASQNLITGGVYIELSEAAPGQTLLRPQAQYRGDTVMASRSGGLDHIQQQLGDLLAKFNRLPLEQTLAEINRSLRSLQTTLNSTSRLLDQPDARALPQELRQTMRDIQQTLHGISPQSPLYGEVQTTLQRLEQTLQAAQPTLRQLEQRPNALIFAPAGTDPVPKGVR